MTAETHTQLAGFIWSICNLLRGPYKRNEYHKVIYIQMGYVRASLGRPLSGGAANTTVTLLAEGTMYGERLNQLDLRFGKIIRVARTRTIISLDLYNATNADTVRLLNNNVGAWLAPTEIVLARFAKISAQFDF